MTFGESIFRANDVKYNLTKTLLELIYWQREKGKNPMKLKSTVLSNECLDFIILGSIASYYIEARDYLKICQGRKLGKRHGSVCW